MADVARKYDVCLKTATAHLKRHSIAIRQQHGIPAAHLPEAAVLRAAGWTYQQLGEKYGCSRTTVSNQLRQTKNLTN